MNNIGQILIVDANRLDQLEQKVDSILNCVQPQQRTDDAAVPFPVFCKRQGISRVTGYAWRDRGLIVMERRGGRQFVVEDKSAKRYQRARQ